MIKFYIRKEKLWYSGKGRDGWTYKVKDAMKFDTFLAADIKRTELRDIHEHDGLTVEMFAPEDMTNCANCGRYFTDDVCNKRLECYGPPNDEGMCFECADYFRRREANPNRDQNVHVRMKAKLIGPQRHFKTKEVIGYHVSIYMGRNRKPINTIVRLDQIEELELLQ